MATEPADRLIPGFSASGQDVWLERAQFQGPGLVVSAVGARCGKVFEAKGEWGVVANTAVLIPQADHDPHFLWYLVNDERFWEKGGTAQPYVRVPETLDRRVLLPPPAEQRLIADFLDAETARIDALIAKKRRLISVLAQRRQAVIDDAVEGSGPLRRVRYLTSRITSGPRGWAEYAAESGKPFLRITNIQRANIELDMTDTLLVDAPRTAESRRTEVVAGDVLVSITADIGCVAVARHELAGANVSQHVALLTPAGCESEWLAYCISATQTRAQLDAGQYGGTKTQLSLGDIAGMSVPVPDLSEQRSRLTHLTSALERQGRCVDLLQRQVRLLVEHRQALITAAVTGELSVPGVAA